MTTLWLAVREALLQKALDSVANGDVSRIWWKLGLITFQLSQL